MHNVLVIVDTDIIGDWVVLPRTAPIQNYPDYYRAVREIKTGECTFQYPGTGDASAGPIFPRTRIYVHSYRGDDYATFTARENDYNQANGQYIMFPNAPLIHYLAAQHNRRNMRVYFVNQSNLIEAYDMELPPLQTRFDLVVAMDAGDLFQFDTRSSGSENFTEIADVAKFYDWIEENVGPLANSPWKDVADAFNFKSLYNDIFSDFQRNLIPTVGFRNSIQGNHLVVRWSAEDRDRLEGMQFNVNWNRAVVKCNFSYGGKGVKIIDLDGNGRAPLTRIPDRLRKRLQDADGIIQPYIQEVKHKEYKVSLPRGVRTKRGEEVIALIGENQTYTIYGSEGGNRMSPTVACPVARRKLFDLSLGVAEKLSFKRIDAEHLAPGTFAPRVVSTSRAQYPQGTNSCYLRVDVAWNGETGNAAEFLINEVMGIAGAWTYNQNLGLHETPQIQEYEYTRQHKFITDAALSMSGFYSDPNRYPEDPTPENSESFSSGSSGQRAVRIRSFAQRFRRRLPNKVPKRK